MKWHEGPVVAVDTETTGINPHDDRIVTAAIVHHTPGQRPRTLQWLIDPGVDIPTEASDVHGWTRDRLDQALHGHEAIYVVDGNAQGVSREGALYAIAAQLGTAIGADAAIVAANAAFDFTLIENELARHGIDTLSSRPRGVVGVVDPMVLDKQFDPYRKGCYRASGCNPADGVHTCGGCRGGKHKCGGCGVTNRKLESLCLHYGVPLTAAHDAGADALAALRLARRLMEVWPDAARLKLGTLHAHQVSWRAEQMDGLRAWFDKTKTEHDGCCGEWPVHTNCAPALVGGAA